MRPQWVEELGGVAVGAVVFGLFLFLGTILQLNIGSRDSAIACYEQNELGGVHSSESPVESMTISVFPLALKCNWRSASSGVVSVAWPNLVPTFVSTGGLLLVIGGVVVLRENRRPR